MVYVPQPYAPAGTQPNSPTRPPQTGYASSGYAPAPSHSSSTTSVYAPASSSSAYAPASSSSAYAPASSSSGYSSAYGPPISSTSSSTATYGYSPAPAPGAGGYSIGGSTNNGNSAYAPASSTYAPSARSNSPLPDFSQALDRPAPTVTHTPSTYSPSPDVATTSRVAGFNSFSGTTMAKPGSTSSSSALSSAMAYASAVAIPVTNNTGGYGSSNSGGGGGGGGYYDKPTSTSSAVLSVSAVTTSTTYKGGPTGGLVSEGNPTVSNKIDYEIKGHEMQIVEIELDPQETVIAEAGAMMYLEEGIDFKTKFGDGSTPKEGFFKKLMQAGGRLLAGESLFLTHFSNIGTTRARAAFAAPFPGTIMPMNLQDLGGSLICQKDGFLCAAKGTKVSMHLNKKLGAGFLGGEGFILQKLSGDGMAFVHAGGTVIRRELRGEKLRIDTGCVVAFTEGINFDIQFVPGLKSMIFGGEGLTFATLQGTGTVWMQSLPFSRMADHIVKHAPCLGGRRQGEGSALTGKFGDMATGSGLGFKF